MLRRIALWCWKVNCEANWAESDRLRTVELSLLRRMINKAPKGSINLALGELGFPFPRLLANYASSILQDANPCYTANAGMIELREKIAEKYYRAQSDTICICNGAEESLYIALQVLINSGDIVAIPDPDYPAYTSLTKLAGAKIIRPPFLKGFTEIDLDLWDKMLEGTKILLLSNPSNPSGFCFDQAQFESLAKILNRRGIILIVDEIYSDLYIHMPYRLEYKLVDRIIVINGLSKSHLMSGWRIGWLYADKEFISAATKLKQYISTCSSWLSQKLAYFAVDQQQIPDEIRQNLNINQRLVQSILQDYNLHIPTNGPYIMFQVHDSLSAAEEYLQKGVITAPGISFGARTKDWIRINIGLQDSILQSALKRLI
nr:aspartate aminotransferase [Candidatus Cloacimonadota bacterium]